MSSAKDQICLCIHAGSSVLHCSHMPWRWFSSYQQIADPDQTEQMHGSDLGHCYLHWCNNAFVILQPILFSLKMYSVGSHYNCFRATVLIKGNGYTSKGNNSDLEIHVTYSLLIRGCSYRKEFLRVVLSFQKFSGVKTSCLVFCYPF